MRNGTACGIVCYRVLVDNPSRSVHPLAITTRRNGNVHSRLGKVCSNPARKGISFALWVNEGKRFAPNIIAGRIFTVKCTACKVVGYLAYVVCPSRNIRFIAKTTFRNGNAKGRLCKICSTPTDKGISLALGSNEGKRFVLRTVFNYVFTVKFTAYEVVFYGVFLRAPNCIKLDFKITVNLVIVIIKLPFNEAIAVFTGCFKACKIRKRIESGFYCIRTVVGGRIAKKRNSVLLAFFGGANVHGIRKIAAVHTVDKLYGDVCRQYAFYSFFEVAIFNIRNSFNNGDSLLGIGKTADILIYRHSLSVLTLTKKCICLSVTEKRNSKCDNQQNDSCKRHKAGNAYNSGFFCSFCRLFFLDSSNFSFTLTLLAFFFCFNSRLFFGFSFIFIPFFKAHI